jgi:hypothetical protein
MVAFGLRAMLANNFTHKSGHNHGKSGSNVRSDMQHFQVAEQLKQFLAFSKKALHVRYLLLGFNVDCA